MNTELLRGDERPEGELWGQRLIELLRQHLIEEREKNADLNQELNSLSDGLREVEAELAEARKDSARLDWALEQAGVSMCRNSVTSWLHNRDSIDAAMKESHNL